MSDFFKIDQEITIPIICPETERRYGSISRNPKKKILLGTKQRVMRIEGKKIVVGSGWYFYEDDLLGINVVSSEPFTPPPIQTFDPENLTV